MARFEKRDPKTKEDFVNRILSYDFDGDIKHLGAGDARLERTGAQSFRIHFPDTGRTFELVVRIPRDAERTKTGARAGPPVEERQEVRPRRSRMTGEERSFSGAPGSPEAEAEEPAPQKKRTYVRRSQRGAQG